MKNELIYPEGNNRLTKYIKPLLPIINQANEAILTIYDKPELTSISYKEDSSPLTNADKAAHIIIGHGLTAAFPNIPIISEEADEQTNLVSLQSDEFWVVDPLDGTKEFIKHNGQFTVCIALIKSGKPIFGVVSVPALKKIYYGGAGTGSYVIDANGVERTIKVAAIPTGVVFGSVSYPNAQTNDYIKRHYPNATIQEYGSQLKLVKIAEGLGDAYPRLGTTMRIWDVAAGHAILEGAGGKLIRPDGSIIDYSKPPLPGFYAGDFVASR